jgi:hypothetical protein
VLNIIELPPSLPSKLELWKNKQPSASSANTNRRSLFLPGKMPQYSFCESMNSCSFDEQLMPSASASGSTFSLNNSNLNGTNQKSTEHKLKVLESNFNQIAMSHYLDEQLVQTCIDMYREKYKKIDNHMQLLFDEINSSLNKVVAQINTSPFMSESCSLAASRTSNSDECIKVSSKSQSVDSRSNSSYNLYNDSINNSNVCLTNSSDSGNGGNNSNTRVGKIIQENLNSLKKNMINLRKSVIDMITTSSTISGLKQVGFRSFFLVKIELIRTWVQVILFLFRVLKRMRN